MNTCSHLKNSQRERIGQLPLVNDERMTQTTIHTNAGKHVQLGVQPVEPLTH